MNYVASGYVRSGYVRQDNDTVDGVTFDRYGKHLYISEDVTSIDLTEVYTATKNWLIQDDNMRNLPPMKYSGYDPIPGGYTGTTFFIVNGWKLVYNPNTTAISGVLFSEDYDTGYWSYTDLPIYPVMISATVNTVYKEFGTSGLTEDESEKLAAVPTAEEIWAYVDRTLTESVAATVDAEDIWTHPTRSLTTNAANLDEGDIHNALDSYANKDDWKAENVTVDVSGLEAKVDAILVDTSDMQPRVIEIEERTAEVKAHTDSLHNYDGLHAELDSYTNKDDWKADQTSELNILTAINGLNDISALDVRSVFDAPDFQAKNTETEIHTWLDTYENKNNWKAVVPEVDTDVNVISVNGVAVAGPDDLKGTPTDVSGIAGDVWSYLNRDLTVPTGLTVAQDAKLDGILADTANMQPKVVEVEQRTVDVLNQVNTLSNYSTLHQDLDNYVNKDDWKSATTSITPVISAINALNDVSAAEVRAAFNVEDFKSKNTENEIHTYLDSYLNKANWKADVSATQNVLDAVNGLNNLSLAEVEGSTVLAKSIALSAVASDITSLINDGYTVNLDPVLTVLTGMNDVSAADVRAAFDENEFKDKNTELELHTWLDSYVNKDDWKAVVPVVDLGPILSAIGALNNLSLIDIEGSAVLAKKATLDAIVASVAQIPTDLVDLTPVTNGIAGLNDVTPAEVRAAFNTVEFKDKNTELEIHAWLDSYTGKENWGGTLTTTTKTELTTEIWDKVI